MVIISVLTLGWMREETEHLQHFVYLCKANGSVIRLVCVGECGDGLEGDLFTCGGCGRQTAQGVDDRTAPRSVSCGGGGAVWRFGERRSSKTFTRTCSHHLWSGAWVWTVWICERFTWASTFESLLRLLLLIFPWCPCELTHHPTSQWIPLYPELPWEWDRCHLAFCMWIIVFQLSLMPMTGCWQ